MSRYLITQSLIGSWLYTYSCAEGYEEEAYQSFLDTLNRVPSEQNEAMKAGSDFEALVYRIADGESPDEKEKNVDGAAKVAEYVRGGQYQVRLQRELEACGMSFLVYGVLDALKAGEIFDIKFKTKSLGSVEMAGNYLESPQHPFYFYLCPEAYRFTYLVSDGKDLYAEQYTPNACPTIEEYITWFVEFLKSSGLLEVYKTKWESK